MNFLYPSSRRWARCSSHPPPPNEPVFFRWRDSRHDEFRLTLLRQVSSLMGTTAAPDAPVTALRYAYPFSFLGRIKRRQQEMSVAIHSTMYRLLASCFLSAERFRTSLFLIEPMTDSCLICSSHSAFLLLISARLIHARLLTPSYAITLWIFRNFILLTDKESPKTDVVLLD